MRQTFIYKAQNSILSASLILAVTSLLNVVFGLVKGRLLTAYFFSTPELLAVFYIADRVPNVIHTTLIVGAISTVFIPIFSASLKTSKTSEEALRTASSVITATYLAFLILTGLALLLSYPLIKIQTAGTLEDGDIALGVSLMRIMLLGQLILVSGSIVSSILQTYKRFILPGLAPVVYNIGLIAGTVLLSNRYGIYGPAYGIVLGSLMHLLIQLPAIRHVGFEFSFSVNLKDKLLRKMFVLVPPRLINILSSSVLDTVNNMYAILINPAAVIFLKNSMQIQTFPINLFGISIASAALPTLSQEAESDNPDKFKKVLVTTLMQMFFLVAPASVLLIILRIPTVRLIFGVGAYDWEATIKTSYAVAFFGMSVFAQSANILLTRAFFALKDTITPLIISVSTIGLNMVLTYVTLKMYTQNFTLAIGLWLIPFFYTVFALADFALLLYLINKKLGNLNFDRIIESGSKIGLSSLAMGIFLYLPLKALDIYVLDTTRTIYLLILCGVVSSVGMAAYLVITSLLKVEEIELFYKLLTKLNIKKSQPPHLSDLPQID